MKGPLVAVIVALAACTSAGSSTPTLNTSPSASTGGVAVVVDPTSSTSGMHSIYLIGLNGRVLATAKAANPSPITSWPLASPILNLWSTYATASDTRAYYRDGDASVRYLDRTGATGAVATVPGDAKTRSFFAVSPDDSQIAVSVLDYSTPPIVHIQFYVQNLSGAGTRSPIPVAANVFFWPVGWHAGDVVVQVGQPIPQTTYGAYPDAAAELRVIDPKTGSTVAKVGGPGCGPMPSLATPVGVVCADSSAGAFNVLGWDGKALGFSGPLGTGGASLSTDGRWVATSGTYVLLDSSPGAGSRHVVTTAEGYPGEAGWIDSTHFVYRLANTSQEVMYDITSGYRAPLSVDGILVARIPGGL